MIDLGVAIALVVTGAYFTAAVLCVGVAAMVGWGEWMLARQPPKNPN